MVIDFFMPRPTDPVPYKEDPTDVSSQKQDDDTQKTDIYLNDDCSNDDDEIVYVRLFDL